ncbi:MAG: hypothetical protein ACRDOL_41195 [Streptosporangiaceae bacterium]
MFVQTDNAAGNTIVAYTRTASGGGSRSAATDQYGHLALTETGTDTVATFPAAH